MPKIIQITDSHIVPAGEIAYGVVDTAAALRETVASVNRVLPRVGPVDLVMVTGDLTEFGGEDDYALFREILAPLAVPYRVIPGNHDRREPMRAAWAHETWMPEAGPIQWTADLGDLVLIALDTLHEGKAGGRLGPQSHAFLHDSLTTADGKPVLLALHHPPITSGIVAMDRIRLADTGPLADLVADYPGELRLVCGHLHRSIAGLFAGRLCQVCPGTSHAVALDQRNGPEGTIGFALEPSGFLLHEVRDGHFVSHWLPVGTFPGPYPFP